MPSLQVVDLSPSPRTEYTPLEKTLSSFSDQFVKGRQEAREADELRSIYDQHLEDGDNIKNILRSVQTSRTLSPTAKVNTINQLLGHEKHNAELLKKTKADMEKDKKVKANRLKVYDIAQRRGLDQETADAYSDDPRLFEQITRPEKPKAAPGGLGGIPLTPEESSAIENVVRDNPDATAEDLEMEFNKQGTPPGRTSKILESRRRLQEQKAKTAEEDKKISRKEEIEFHRESQKYDEELSKSAKTAKNQLDTIGTIDKALKSKSIRPSSMANIFKGFGSVGEKIANAFLSGDAATLQASIPGLLEGWKEVFGVRLSDADLKVLQDKLPDIGKSLEANQSILKVMKKYAKNSILRSKIGSEIKRSNKGLRPLNYSDLIEDRFEEMTQPVKIVSPVSGKVISIPAYEVGDAIESGAKLFVEENQGGDDE